MNFSLPSPKVMLGCRCLVTAHPLVCLTTTTGRWNSPWTRPIRAPGPAHREVLSAKSDCRGGM